MDNRQLRESLESLRIEVARLARADSDTRDRLEALIADIETRLAEPDNAEHYETLIQNVRDAITEFEVSHPRTTEILNHVMVTLGNMGI